MRAWRSEGDHLLTSISLPQPRSRLPLLLTQMIPAAPSVVSLSPLELLTQEIHSIHSRGFPWPPEIYNLTH